MLVLVYQKSLGHFITSNANFEREFNFKLLHIRLQMHGSRAHCD